MIKINAEEMSELAKSYVKKEARPIDKTIEGYIRIKAKIGQRSVEFSSEEKINYILTHKSDYTDRGFSVTVDSDYGFPMVTISW